MVKQHVIVLIIVAGSMWNLLDASGLEESYYSKFYSSASSTYDPMKTTLSDLCKEQNSQWERQTLQWDKESAARAEEMKKLVEAAKKRSAINAYNKRATESIAESHESHMRAERNAERYEAYLHRIAPNVQVTASQTRSHYPPTFQAATHAPTEGVVQQPILPTSPTTSNPIIPLKREASDTSSTNISNTDAHIESPLWHNEPPGFFDNQILMLAFAVASTGAFFAAKKTAKCEKDTEIMVGVCGTLAIVFGIAAFRAYCKQAKADSKQS